MSEVENVKVDVEDNTDNTPPDVQNQDAKDDSRDSGDELIDKTGDDNPPEGDELIDSDHEDKGEGKDDDKNDDKPEREGAPEDYGKFKFEEGYGMTEENEKSFVDLVRKLDLPKEHAQELINYNTVLTKAQDEADDRADAAQVAAWDEETKKEYGDGYKEAYSYANTAFNTFFSPKVRKVFKDNYLNRDPELFRDLVKMGKTIGEDSIVDGKGSGGSKKPLANRMYKKQV